MKTYDQYTTERTRRGILAALYLEASYRLPLVGIRDILPGAVGYDLSLDRVKTECAWLAEQGYLTLEGPAAMLTERGVDVVKGRFHAPGISRASPGDLEELR